MCIDSVEGLIGQIIGSLNVWLCVRVWSTEVWLERLAEFVVGGISDLDRLGAVWVGLEGLYAIVDDRVVLQVLRGC